MNRHWHRLALIIGFCFLTACMKPIHDSGSQWDLASCDGALKTLFAEELHPFLKTNCATCHASGGSGKGAFADSDLDLAFNQFQMRGFAAVAERAVDPNHKAPYTGTQHEAAIGTIRNQWESLETTNPACAGGEVSLQLKTKEKELFSGLTQQTISWDLQDTVVEDSPSFPGAQIEIAFKQITAESGEVSYELSQPVLRAGNNSLQVEGVFIEVSSVSPVTTFQSIKRAVPAGQSRSLSDVASLIENPFARSDKVTVTVGFEKVSVIDFDPPTYSELVAEEGVLGKNCLSCHNGSSAAGGLDLSNGESLTRKMLVIPYMPAMSGLIVRMSSETSPMPPRGRLDLSERKKVIDWIIDGAPLN